MADAADWLKASTAQRQVLYETVRTLVRLRDTSWAELFHVLGLAYSDTFLENFRQGRIARRHAARIYQHLLKAHPACIPGLDSAAFANARLTAFLNSYRYLGLVTLLPEFVDIPFRSLRLGPGWAEWPMYPTRPIQFRVRLPYIYPALIAFHQCSEGYFPVELDTVSDVEFSPFHLPEPQLPHPFRVGVTQGAQTVTTAPPNKAQAIRREGRNMFIFIAGDGKFLYDLTEGWHPDRPLTREFLEALPDRMLNERTGWIVAQLNVTGAVDWTR